MVSEAQKRAYKKYKDRTRKQFNIDLNSETESDIIDWLDRQDNKRGAVKELIRKAIQDSGKSLEK